MLGNYLKFNTVQFPNPTNCTMTSSTIENVSQSEAGTDLVCVVRSSKKKWSMSFNLTSGKRDTLKSLAQAESTQMYYMGTSYNVRIRDFKEKLAKDSECVSRSEGLFECSVSITEF